MVADRSLKFLNWKPVMAPEGFELPVRVAVADGYVFICDTHDSVVGIEHGFVPSVALHLTEIGKVIQQEYDKAKQDEHNAETK